MFATLVVCLPSRHEGGTLIVSHDGLARQVEFGGAGAEFNVQYAAFYADCQHEIRPLESGYRLCLTYNLTLARSRGKKRIAAPTYGPTIAAISELLGDWCAGAAAEKLAVTLDHHYTQNGLSIDKLKGIDRARAEVLFEAAEQANCVAHLALVTLWQGGAQAAYHAHACRGHVHELPTIASPTPFAPRRPRSKSSTARPRST